MGFKKDVIVKLEKLTVEVALNNKILTDHHVRTSQIEARVVPLEASHIFFNKLAKAIMGLVTLIGGIAAIYKYLF